MIVAGDHVPVMPLLDVPGNAAGVAFWQYGPNKLNIGVITGVTVIVIVAGVAHWPAVGVNVYVVVVVLFNAGDHVPVIPLFEVVGRVLNTAPEQMGATPVKTGLTKGLTVMVRVAGTAHNPAVGANV